MNAWPELLRHKHAVIGMLHLEALPGSPGYQDNLQAVLERVLVDAKALLDGGVHALMLENFGDVPFSRGRVEAETIAAMTMIASEVRKLSNLPLGINVLRNDGESALAIAVASRADFIRVNALSGARVTDQGIIEGIAYDLMRLRSRLKAERVAVLADVDVKHSAPLAPRPLSDEVEDTVLRGLADGVIVSGAGTGKKADPGKVAEVQRAAHGRPVFLGSGVTSSNVREYLNVAQGFIVGTHFKAGGVVGAPVDISCVRNFMKSLAYK